MRAYFIYEKFIHDSDPIKDMHIGIYSLIKSWLKEYGITKYKINDDFSIDVKGDVLLSNKGTTRLPEYIQFNEIHGSFYMFNNPLDSLIGYPKITKSWCSCQYTNITLIDYDPVDVKHFFCNHCSQLSEKEVLNFVKRMKNKDMYIYSDYGDFYKGKKI